MSKEDAKITGAASSAAPDTSVYLNLDNYLDNANGTPYDSTSLPSSIHYIPLTGAKGQILSLSKSNGFKAEAFASVDKDGHVTSDSQVVIAYSENDPAQGLSATNVATQFEGSVKSLIGGAAPASARFAKTVIARASALGIDKNHINVTGHSFGGADAEYAADATGLGGATFGAPGIKTNATGVTNFVNYVNDVDPIGNYSTDPTDKSGWGAAVNHAIARIAVLKLPAFLQGHLPPAAQAKIEGVIESLLQFDHYGSVSSVTAKPGELAKFAASLDKSAAADSTKLPSLETSLGIPLLAFLTKIKPYGQGDYNALAQYAKELKVTLDPLCFASGTKIQTARGEIAVENLRVGDRVATASGGSRAVRWLGHRTLDLRGAERGAEASPVRVSAHAFGAGLPRDDLFLSPGHPVLVGGGESGKGGFLVPIMCLINGTTVVRTSIGKVTYWHVELDQHDILLAEGLPAESYLDLGCRAWFEGGENLALAHPDFVPPGFNGRCRPVALDGAVVDAERRRLAMIFEMNLSEQCVWPATEQAAVWL